MTENEEWFPDPLKKEPKVQTSFGGCYNYDRLKAANLVDEVKEPPNIHQIMYEMATMHGSNVNIGGSDNLHA